MDTDDNIVENDINICSFQDFGFSETLINNIKESNLESPTSVQKMAIGSMLTEQSILVQSPPNTGKTLVYVLSLLEIMTRNKLNINNTNINNSLSNTFTIDNVFNINNTNISNNYSILILTSTIELYNKIYNEFIKLNNNLNISINTIKKHNKNDDIIISDIHNSNLNNILSSMQIGSIVVDDADQVIHEVSFTNIINTIYNTNNNLYNTNNNLIFSFFTSSLTKKDKDKIKEIYKLFPNKNNAIHNENKFNSFMSNFRKVMNLKNNTNISNNANIKNTNDDSNVCEIIVNPNDIPTLNNLNQYYIKCDILDKLSIIRNIIHNSKYNKCMIYCNKSQNVQYIYDKILNSIANNSYNTTNNIDYYTITEYDPFDIRLHTLNAFKKNISLYDSLSPSYVTYANKVNNKCVLVTTDILSRGIEVSDIDMVINYDMPNNPHTYLYRVGNTVNNSNINNSNNCINLVCNMKDIMRIKEVIDKYNTNINEYNM